MHRLGGVGVGSSAAMGGRQCGPSIAMTAGVRLAVIEAARSAAGATSAMSRSRTLSSAARMPGAFVGLTSRRRIGHGVSVSATSSTWPPSISSISASESAGSLSRQAESGISPGSATGR